MNARTTHDTHDIIVVGASAGGVEATAALVAGLPADLRAALFVVVHFPATATSVLPHILARAGKLPAAHAVDGEPVVTGRIYVAPPDTHLVLDQGTVRLLRGPKENSARPAVDPLFRTAARAYGPRVIGVILSGSLDDGTAGLMAIKRRGGVAVVQAPEDALFDGMPRSAVENVDVDMVAPVRELAAHVARVVETPARQEVPTVSDDVDFEAREERESAEMPGDGRPGRPSVFACPECHGTLWEVQEGELIRFRCRVGHAYSAETLLNEQAVGLEAALWTALRALEESAALSRRLAARAQDRGQGQVARRFRAHAHDLAQRAATVRAALDRGGEADTGTGGVSESGAPGRGTSGVEASVSTLLD